MRRAELCRLKVGDIDSQRMMIRIDQGKGGRDREVPLSPTLLKTLRVYWRWMKPKTYLFPGTVNGWRADVPISPNTFWLACRPAAQAAVAFPGILRSGMVDPAATPSYPRNGMTIPIPKMLLRPSSS
jgi:integrase